MIQIVQMITLKGINDNLQYPCHPRSLTMHI